MKAARNPFRKEPAERSLVLYAAYLDDHPEVVELERIVGEKPSALDEPAPTSAKEGLRGYDLTSSRRYRGQYQLSGRKRRSKVRVYSHRFFSSSNLSLNASRCPTDRRFQYVARQPDVGPEEGRERGADLDRRLE